MGANAMHIPQGHEQETVATKSHDLNRRGFAGTRGGNKAKIADMHRRTFGFDGQSNDIDHLTAYAHGIRVEYLLSIGLKVQGDSITITMAAHSGLHRIASSRY